MNLAPYLQPTYFLDSDSQPVRDFAAQAGTGTALERAVHLYYAVRDQIRYDPYDLDDQPESLRASSIISKGSGYCVAKAVVLAAVTRSLGIPARLGFADVRNHLSTTRLRELMGTDLFIWHGYTELFLEDRWVKATPAFNLSLCQRFAVRPLEFTGREDSIFHEHNAHGKRHMEYVSDHGTFADLPHAMLIAAYRARYPALFAALSRHPAGDFHAEATSETSSLLDQQFPHR